MKLVGERRLFAQVLYFFLLLERGLTGPWQGPNDDCDSSIEDNKCVNGRSYINYLLAIACVALVVFPMLFCCSKSKNEYSPNSPQISKEPVHVYDEIDESIALSNKTSETKTSCNLKEDVSQKYDRYQSEVEFQMKKEQKLHQASMSSPRDTQAPELPDREYLTDIEFVAQEFDLLLRRAPELPKRSEDSAKLLLSTNVVVNDKTAAQLNQVNMKRKRHETQQSLIQQELERSVAMTSNPAPPKEFKGSKKITSTSQSQAKTELVMRKLPASRALTTHQAPAKREIKARKVESEFSCSANSVRQKPLKLQTSTRPLPYRQPLIAEQLPGDQTLTTCPTYENVTEESPHDVVNYQNVTGDLQGTLNDKTNYQNIAANQKQKTREEAGTYQPLLFYHTNTEEDEYIDVNTAYY